MKQTTGLVLPATRLAGEKVVNPDGESLGKIEEFVVDIDSGRIAYAVLSFGGFLGIGEKLFAIPWAALNFDVENKRFVLPVPKERLKAAPGFDKGQWPQMADRAWAQSIYDYYGQRPHWD